MKNRYKRRRRQHLYKAMQAYPAYLHPHLDDWGELAKIVPWEVWEEATKTFSAAPGTPDALWFGLTPDHSPQRRAALERAAKEKGEAFCEGSSEPEDAPEPQISSGSQYPSPEQSGA